NRQHALHGSSPFVKYHSIDASNTLDRLPALDLPAGLLEGSEVLRHRVIDEDVAVGEEEDHSGDGARLCGSSGRSTASSRPGRRWRSCPVPVAMVSSTRRPWRMAW